MRLVGVFLVKVSTQKKIWNNKKTTTHTSKTSEWIQTSFTGLHVLLALKNLKPTNLLKVSAAPYAPHDSMTPMTFAWKNSVTKISNRVLRRQRRSKISRAHNPPGWDSLKKKKHQTLTFWSYKWMENGKWFSFFNWMIFWFHVSFLQGLYWLVDKDPYNGFL